MDEIIENDNKYPTETPVTIGENELIGGNTTRSKEDPLYWSERVRFNSYSLSYEGITFDMLSTEVKEIFEAYTKALKCPFEYVFFSGMVAACTATGKRVSIKVGPFINYPQIYCAIVGRSGLGKTPPINAMIEPLVDLDNNTYEIYQERLKTYRDNVKPKNRTAEETPKWTEQLILSDTTPEALYEVLSYSQYGILWHYDELAGLFANMFRYGKKNDFPDKLLSIYNNQTFKFNRKYGIGNCTNPCMSIIGGIQPRRLIETFGKYDNGAGFLGRWCFIVPSSDKVPENFNFEDVPIGVKQDWRNLLLNLSSLNQCEYRLSHEAEDMYSRYYAYNQRILNTNHFELELEEEIRHKMYSEILRIALVLHLLGNTPDNSEISFIELDNAIVMREQILKHTISIFKQAQTLKAQEEIQTSKLNRGDKFRVFLDTVDVQSINNYLTDDQWGNLFGLSRKTVNEIKNEKIKKSS